MTANGRRIAFFIGLAIAFMLPRRVECGYPGAPYCGELIDGRRCNKVEVEPWGFYLIEHLASRNIGFAYSTDIDCN
jgi:hypothetical protein